MKCTCGQHELNGVAALSCGDGVIHRPVAPCYHLEQSMTTPRTDAFARAGAYMKDGDYTSTQGKQFVHIDDARQLEQELNEAHAEKRLILSKLRGISFGLSTHPSDTPLNGCLISEASKEKLKSLDELIEYHEPKS